MKDGGFGKIETFKDKLFAAARAKGFTEYEVFYTRGSAFSVKVFDGEIREYKNAGDEGLSFRGAWKGKMGYAFTERIGGEVIPFLVDHAAENADIIDDPDIEDLYPGPAGCSGVKTWDESLALVTPETKVEKALALERAARDHDGRVEALDYCQLGSGDWERYIANSLGLECSTRANSAYAYAFVRVRGADGQVKTNGEIWAGKALAALDTVSLGKKAAENALSHLGAAGVPTGNYKIIFSGNAMGDLLGAFSQAFNAENVQKGFSLLKGKLGEPVASGILSIRDDPLIDQLPGSAPFDCEGVAAENKALIEGGILKTFLHNRKTARKDGVKPTGNGFKSSFKAPVGIAPTNFYIVPGGEDQESLLSLMGEGLLITDLEGLHAGANAVSGDFSLSAEGFLVEKGRKVRAVEQITVAGNFFTLLREVEALGKDLEFKGPISSPSVLVKSLSVAGLG